MALPSPSELIAQVGEPQAKLIYREYFRDPANLEEFAELFYDYVPTKLAEFHGEIFDYYEDEGNVGIAAPRGFSKSTITDTIYLAHRALYARSHFPVLISDTYTQATMLLDGLGSELGGSNELIEWIYGDVKGERWSSEGLIVRGYAEDGSREEVLIIPRGAGMKVRGLRFKQYRPDLIIMDDLENDELVESPERREKLYNWLVKAVIPAMAKDVGKIIIIGTTLHRESLLSRILRREGIFSGWKTHRYQGITDGKSLWPERFSIEHLLAMRDDPQHEMYLGPISFSQEIQNEPISEQDQIIRPEWLQSRYSLLDTVTAYQHVIRARTYEKALYEWLSRTFSNVVGHIDPAISEKETADWWAMLTIGVTKACPLCEGHPAGHVMILDYLRFREADPEKQANMIGEQFLTWRHDKLKLEAVAYQAGLYQLTRRIAQSKHVNLPIVPWKPDRSKRRRAIMQAGMFAGGMVHLRSDHPLCGPFVEEVVQFPQGDHDDMFDAYLGAAEQLVLKSKRRVFTNKPKGF
ncbi:MAG TPA: hypothetical protein VFH39_04505 [Candidatus Saccharimonadales bacterium]|nr:hypothetical protein [Candidatus Saccharimonadales bacterium]